MDKLKMHSLDLSQQNIEKIRALFPNCVTESRANDGRIKLAVDFDQLKQELSDAIVDGPQERYHLNWPGKREALLTANAPIAKTLRPNREESIDFDKTKNLFIEGDNLEALKLLQESYLGEIDVIYIDPPYNTGNDFVYKDDFVEDIDSYLLRSNLVDEDGNRLVSNKFTNGRFHSDWLTMMYSRLKLARNLLAKDGVIFISIDDNEVANLRRICIEIFGEENEINPIIHNKLNAKNDTANVQKNHEYVLCFRKTTTYLSDTKIKPSLIRKAVTTREVFKDDSGRFYILKDPITTRGDGGTLNKRENLGYSIYYNQTTGDFVAICDYDKELAKTSNDENQVYSNDQDMISKGYVAIRPPKVRGKLGAWTWEISKFNLERDLILIKTTKNGFTVNKREFVSADSVYEKDKKFFIDYVSSENSRSIVDFSTNDGSVQLSEILGKDGVFDNPKNINLIKYLINLIPSNDITILDFFAGSASSAHATMQLNSEDGGNRRFIMVQLPELCDEKSEAYAAGYRTISDISKDRIAKSGRKLLGSLHNNTWNRDVGFRVLKIDTSNMAEVFYSPTESMQASLNLLVDNIKSDRTAEDLLFQVLLDWGLDLSSQIEEKLIADKKVYLVNENAFLACFDNRIDEKLITELAKLQPLRAVFRDDAFESDALKINAEQIFLHLSPQTEIKTI